MDDTSTHHTSSKRTTSAFAWGYNNRAGLGLGHSLPVPSPVRATLPPGTIDVQGGINFTVALTSSGQVFAWGGNQYGQLGDGTTTLRRQPTAVKVPGRSKISAIAVGTDHVLALTSRGRVLAWGRNHRGQVGNGSTADQHAPITVDDGVAVSVAAGNGVSAKITRNGSLYTWGRNNVGQLGLRDNDGAERATSLAQLRPARAQLPQGVDATAVDAGHRHLSVVTRDGRLVLLGLDAQGKPVSDAVPLTPGWGRPVRVWAGEDFTLVLTDRHALLGIGGNASGQLGVGDHANRLRPTAISLPRARGHVVDMWAGARSAVAITNRHEVYTWGDASAGQAGRGVAFPDEPVTQPRPHKVTSLPRTQFTGVGGGAHHVILTAKHR